MPDDLRTRLTSAADTAVSGEAVPDVSLLRGRSRGSGPGTARHRGWLAPILAAAAVLAVAAGVTQLPGLHDRAATVAIPAAPKLERVVPPLVVAKRLGAPAGHLNGPPVAYAATLAVSPARQGGLSLRTAAVVTPHTPDAAGNTRVNQCRYTYSEPDPVALHGGCSWSVPPGLPATATALTVEIQGAPGQTWLSGTAPAGTAAVLVHSSGRKDVVVPVADPGAQWDHRPFYVVWHLRVGTDLTALDRGGHAVAHTRLPSDVSMRSNSADPQLGTIETPLGLWDQYGDRCRFVPGAPRPSAGTFKSSNPKECPPGMVRDATPAPTRVDVLARYRISDTVTLFRYGLLSGDIRCIVDQVRDYGADAQPGGSGGSCGAGISSPETPPISASQSYSAGTGKPQEQLLSGSAPRGTVRIRLSATGHATEEVRAYDAGDRWDHHAYFITPWPSGAATRMVALGKDGQTLASVVTRGMNLHAFDADFLEAEATCMERHGVHVTRIPQQGVPPAYTFEPGSLSSKEMLTTQNACEDEAKRVTS